jgi:hypothetical protein
MLWLLLSAGEALVLGTVKGGVPGTVPFLAGWCVMCCLLAAASRAGVFPAMNLRQMVGHRVGILLWPLIITVWFSMQGRNIVERHGWPNRVQHLMFAASVVTLLLPALVRWWGGLHRLERVLLAVAVTVLIGSGVELLEYGMRSAGEGDPVDNVWAWRDTMIDTVMNVVGACVASWFLAARMATAPGGRERSALSNAVPATENRSR